MTEVLAWVCVHVLIVLLVENFLCLGIVDLCGDTELCEVAFCLLSALMCMCVLNLQPQHRCAGLASVKDALDVAIKLEEILLLVLDLPYLQSYGFFNDCL